MTGLINNLIAQTGLGPSDIRRILHGAPEKYKVFHIPKRNGDFRVIAQPARELKMLQRAFVEAYLSNLPVHAAATAYRKGTSLLANAEPHAGNGPILKLDFENFFPSLRSTDWERYCYKNSLFQSQEEVWLSSRLLFRKDPIHHGLRMAIGAPSSPILSNILMYDFDSLVAEAVGKDHVRYTRYADDMAFSAQRTGYLTHIEKTVAQIARHLEGPRLTLNSSKTVFVTRKFRRSVTGLTLANDGRITIGKERKRKVRAMLHHAAAGKLDQDQWRALAGILAYINSVEPSFISSLEKKYGKEFIMTVQRSVSKAGRLPDHAPLFTSPRPRK